MHSRQPVNVSKSYDKRELVAREIGVLTIQKVNMILLNKEKFEDNLEDEKITLDRSSVIM